MCLLFCWWGKCVTFNITKMKELINTAKCGRRAITRVWECELNFQGYAKLSIHISCYFHGVAIDKLSYILQLNIIFSECSRRHMIQLCKKIIHKQLRKLCLNPWVLHKIILNTN